MGGVMRELSLFAGAGGGLLGTKLLGFKHAGYVEINDYCQRILAQRIKDGLLDEAPIFSDIRTFISEGYSESYKGMVDVITAGFPCQPFSVAGKRKHQSDSRNMWPETIGVIRIIRPQYILLENVPGLLSRGHRYFEEILKDLAESGYDAKWKIISASELGAPHKRDRLFVLANYNGQRGRIQQEFSDRKSKVHTNNNGKEKPMANSCIQGLEGWQPPCGESKEYTAISDNSWWSVEPGMGRVADGVANRVDRIKAIGNGQVPAVVREALIILTGNRNENP